MPDYHLFDVENSIDHELPVGKTIIGRGADCDIRLMSSSVSRKHAMLELSGHDLVFSDLGSSNGSFVNGISVNTPVTVRNGDELLLGELHFTINQVGGMATSDDFADDDATQIAPSEPAAEEIPAIWSESAGLEDASGTQFSTEADESEAVDSYRQGKLNLPPIGNSPRLVGLSGHLNGKVFELATGDRKGAIRTWKIGRDADTVDLVIADSNVSGQHAQLVNEDARWKVVNWMSTNGTFVNGEKGLSTYLKSGDIIRLGGTELAFELPANSGTSVSRQGLFSRILGWLKRSGK